MTECNFSIFTPEKVARPPARNSGEATGSRALMRLCTAARSVARVAALSISGGQKVHCAPSHKHPMGAGNAQVQRRRHMDGEDQSTRTRSFEGRPRQTGYCKRPFGPLVVCGCVCQPPQRPNGLPHALGVMTSPSV